MRLFIILLGGRPDGTHRSVLRACRDAEKLQRQHPRAKVRVMPVRRQEPQ
jgi:hypothetical protein